MPKYYDEIGFATTSEDPEGSGIYSIAYLNSSSSV